MTKSEEQQPLSLQKALQQCELVQNMIDLSISNLEGLRTKCATSNDLTQKEIRTLEVGVAYGEKKKSNPSSPPLSPPPSPFPFCLLGVGWRGWEVCKVGMVRSSIFCDLSCKPCAWMSLHCTAVGCRLAGWWEQ